RASRRLLCFDRALDYGCYAWRGSREQLGLIGLQCLDRQLELLGLMRQLLRRTPELRPAIASELEAQLGDLGLSRDRILRHRRDRASWRTATARRHPTTTASPDRRGDPGSRRRDPRMDPCRVPSAPAPPSCRSLSACRSRPLPARSASPPASPSSQQLDHLPQCLRRDLAADAHPRTATELDVDKPGSFDPPATRPAPRLLNDLDRHQRVAL